MSQELAIQERFSLKDIFSLFLGCDTNSLLEQVPPSCFIQEMSMTTDQRYKKLVTALLNAKYENQFGVDDIFRLLPRVIIFQSFEPGDIYTVTVSVQNTSKVPSPLRMVCTQSPNFQVTYKSPEVVTQVAPGLSVGFEVSFMPDKFRDYKHELTFFTRFSRFSVPIYAIGPRPLLDFPDTICIPSTAVKNNSSKTILIRNIGKIPAVFVLFTERPFFVHPKRAVLQVGELLQVIIFFNCSRAGSFDGMLSVNYETGEKLVVHLQGNAESENIELSHEIIYFQDTFVGLKRQDSVTLHNASSHVIQFKWLSAPPEDKISENSASKESECEDDLFSDPNFSLIPQSGEVWPNGSADTILIFKPTSSMTCQVMAYCEVTGRESCIFLTLRGCGLGPRILLNLESLDISSVFLGSVHKYEVICMNNGDISGTISYASKPLLFGGEVCCSPQSYTLFPGEHRAFVLTFVSNHAGDFNEKITFCIEDSQEETTFTLKGRVINPTVHFTVNELNLGEIPIGFQTEQCVTMCNPSLVPVIYSVTVKSDGNESSVRFEDYARMGMNKIIPMNPKEFTIEPSENVVEPSSCDTVKLTVVPNIARYHTTSVVVKIGNSDDEPACLPLRFVAVYPHIVAVPNEITMDCFINLLYNKTFTLVNDSNIIGYFYILPQKVNTNTSVTYSLAVNEAVMKPYSRVDIPVTVMSSELGFHSAMIKLLVMGASEPVDLCRVACTSQGPVVTAAPDRLQWGMIPLLQPSICSFSLINDSPIPATFYITIDKRNGKWVAKPDRGVVNVNEILHIDVTACLTDVGNFSARLNVHIANSDTLIVRMHAQGDGTSIVTDPPIVPEFNLGTIFSYQCVKREVVIKNEGTKHHQLHWSITSDTPKSGRLSTTTITKQSHFEIITPGMSLLPGESAVLIIIMMSERVETVREELYCYALINYTGKPQPTFATSIVANFVDPLVVFSKPNLHFYINVMEDEPKALEETVTLTNHSVLPLTTVVDVDHPFQIGGEDGSSYTHTTINMEGLSSIELRILFDPAYAEDRCSKVEEGFIHVYFVEHPQKISFPLKGEVNFPNVKIIPEINFDCILVGTNICRDIVIQNVSSLPVDYSWSWVLNSSDFTVAENEQGKTNSIHVYKSFGECNEERRYTVMQETSTDDASSSLACPNSPTESYQQVMNFMLEEDRNNTKIIASDVCLRFKLYHLLAPFLVDGCDAEALEILPLKTKSLPVLKYFELTPHRGHLKPYESMTMWVTFFGVVPLTASVQAKCTVKGGPIETISVTAMAACVSYHLSKRFIDFGKQVFLKECKDVIVLQNSGNMPFDFVVQCSQPSNNSLDGMFLVKPMSGHLLAGKEVELIVTFLPGASGKFVGVFHLKIAYLNPITIQIEGYGSVPQLYVNLPRPAMLALPEEMGYKAISSMENGWRPLTNVMDDNHCSNEDDLILQHWVVVCKKDLFPNVADIELAVESMIAYKHLLFNPSILLYYGSAKNMKSIPELSVPPYMLNVGPVVPETEVNNCVLITNYTPANIYVQLQKMEQSNILKESGFFVEFTNQQLPVGGSADLLLALKPPSKICPSIRRDFSILVNLEVAGGPKIPIIVNGFITVPFVTVQPHLVTFNTVKTGFRSMMAVVVKNEGWLPCVWKAELQLKVNTSRKKRTEFSEYTDATFSISSCEKCFKPGDAELLEIIFTPLKPGEHIVYLVITMLQNPDKIIIVVRGKAVEPLITIIDPEMYFSPCLPYQQSEERHFTIKNPCVFPLEVFLRDFDSQFHKEERILNILFHLYETEVLLLPERTPGDKLPQQLFDFYECVLKQVKDHFMKEEESQKSTKYSDEDEKGKKKGKKISSGSTVVASTATIGTVVHSFPEDPLASKDQEEIDLLIVESLNEMKNTSDFATCGRDSLQKVIASNLAEHTAAVEGAKDGVIIIFHGAPLTENLYTAHKTGRILGLPILNIDQIILEQILCTNTIAGQKVNSFINTAYNEEIGKDIVWHEDDVQQIPEHYEGLDPMEEILSKVAILDKLHNEKSKKPNGSAVKATRWQNSTVRLRGSTQSTLSSQRAANVPSNRHLFQPLEPLQEHGTLANIPRDMLIELLAERFQMPGYSQGLIIEGLKSIFFTSLPTALAAVLIAAGNISHIFCVVLNYSFDDHYKWLVEEKHRKEFAKAADLKVKLEMIENLDDSEMAELKADDRALYDQVEINERRHLLKLRMEERQERQLEKQEKQRQESLRKLKDKGKKSKKKSQMLSGVSVKRTIGRSNVLGSGPVAEPVAADMDQLPSREGSRKLQRPRSARSTKIVEEPEEVTEALAAKQLESELLSAFENFQNDLLGIISLLQNWDRQKGAVVHDITSDAAEDHGIPLWVINCASADCTMSTFIQVVIDNIGLQDMLDHLRKPHELVPPEAITYQHMRRRELRQKSGFSSIFTMLPLDPAYMEMPLRPEDSEESIKSMIELDKSNKFKESKLKSSSKMDVSFPSPSTQKISCMRWTTTFSEEFPKFKTRWLLLPGESVDWKMTFEPKKVGEYSHCFNIEVTGWDRHYTVTGHGICGIPGINTCPSVIYPQVCEFVSKERTFSPTYFIEKEEFDLGSVIISKPKDKNFHQVTANMIFENVSLFPATIHFSFLDKVADIVDYFTLEPRVLSIEPGGHEELKVTATPRLLGTLSEVLVGSIKNNPKIHLFKIICSGARVEFEVDIKNVLFHPSLLHHKDTKLVNLKNKCPVPLLWRFYGNESLNNDFEIFPTEGIITPYETQQAHITYTASKIQIITKKPLRVEIFTDETHREPAVSEVIYLSAETYDVVVDVQFPHPDDDHLNFGGFLVGQEQQQILVLRNKGKYDASFTITLDVAAIEKRPKWKSMILMNPDSGILARSDKPFSIQITVNPQEEIQITKITVFTITIFQNENTIVALIPIQLSISASYATFIIEPLAEINFGPMLVTSKKTLVLNIENTGPYEFKYSVTAANSVAEQSLLAVEKVNDTKKTVAKKGADKKNFVKRSASKVSEKVNRLDTNKLTSGVFLVLSPSGVVAPSEIVHLPVECILDAKGSFHETITVHISGSSLEFKDGVSIKLLAQGCLPTIDYTNMENIFREHYICESIETFERRSMEVTSHCIFSKDDQTLWFRNVCVGTTSVARLRLHNPGLVSSNLCVSAGNDVFSVSPEELTLMPQSTEVLIVSFSPSQLELYSSKLEIIIEMPPTVKSVKIVFNLHGESCIPEVKVTSPDYKTAEGHTLIVFDPTMLKQVRSHQFSLCSTGILPCKVFMEFPKMNGNIFSIYPTKESLHNVLLLIKNEPIQNTTVVSLDPGKSATFDVHFQPHDSGVFEATLKLYIVDNPFENLRIVLRGHGYQEDITLEGPNIEPLVNNDNISTRVQSYHFGLGKCNINKRHFKNFKIVNNSGMSTYRFEWKHHQNVKIVPDVGHLFPSSFTDSVVTFIASEPISLHKVEMKCIITKINILDKFKRTSWNSQQIAAKLWREIDSHNNLENSSEFRNTSAVDLYDSSKNCGDQKVEFMWDEPEYEVFAESSRAVILFVSATADYAKCSCSMEEIVFKDTLMFKNRVFQLELRNIGIVPLEYECALTLVDRLPVFCNSTTMLQKSKSHPLVAPRPQSAVCKCIQPWSKRKNTARPLTDRESLIDTTLSKVTSRNGTSVSSASSNSSWLGDDDIPFSVEPNSGVLSPGETVLVKVTFSPFDTHDYRVKLECLVPNLDPDQKPVEVAVRARSLMPYCHLEVEESDYLSSGRRDPTLPSPFIPLDPETKTIEFRVMGIGATCTKEFYILNPTEQNYTFLWHKDFPSQTNLVEPIVCHTQHGFIEQGKKEQVSFSFVAAEIGVFESFWTLTIPEFDIHTLFLLVGITTEPLVYFMNAHVNLKPTLKGVKTQTCFSLVNNEDIELTFEIENESLFSEGGAEKLSVQPVSGILSPKSEQKLCVVCVPEVSGESLFSLRCNIQKMKNPLKISILGICYSVQPLVSWQGVDGMKHKLRLSGDNILDFKDVSPRQTTNIIFRIVNSGRISFCYQFKYDEDKLCKLGFKLKFSCKGGSVTSQGYAVVTVSCTSFKDTNLDDFEVNLEISQGPTYRMLVQGKSICLNFQFSFTKLDFGPCIIHNPQKQSYKKELFFTNNEEKSLLLLECKYENKPHLEVFLKSHPVLPGESVTIYIIFNPLEVKKYNEKILFVINGSVQKEIQISGEGTEMKVLLVNGQHKIIELGALQIGQVVSKHVPIINKSKASTKINFGFEDLSTDLFQVLKVIPSDSISIQPGEVVKISIIFAPTKMLKPFSLKILMLFNKHSEPLCIVKGNCIGYEFVLDRTYLPFGTVVEGCSSTLKLVLSNVGDLGSKFSWQQNIGNEYFTILPMTGYCSPGCAVTFTVHFHPRQKMQNIRSEVQCKIENYGSLSVVFSGSCVGVPLPKEVISFSCAVRQQDKKHVTVSNKTGHSWQLYPEVSGDFFSGGEILSVKPHTAEHYEVVYTPLSITQETMHSGSVLFCLPDGETLLYSLQGSSQPPQSEGKLTRDILSKTNHIELLPVTNWLQQMQRFTVTTTLVKSEKYDPVFTVTGNDYIDVPGNDTRDYKLIFNIQRESVIIFKVTFSNEETGDFQFYEVILKVGKCAPLMTIKMKTFVRVPTSHKLSLKNLLPQDVNYNIACSAPDVIYPAHVSVPAKSIKHVLLEYLPLQPAVSHWSLEATCNELGEFPYELQLEAIPAPDEKQLIFTTTLGSSISLQAAVHNLSHARADFTCTVNHNDFLAEKNISVPTSTTGSVKVTYEPSSLNSVSAILTVTSQTAGEFIFPLVGMCNPPKPQGPLELKPGTGIAVPFKNVFHDAQTFNMAVDNPVLVLKNTSETVKSKKETKIHVGLQPMKHLNITERQMPVTGKLTISCSDPALSPIIWTYYLKGILDH